MAVRKKFQWIRRIFSVILVVLLSMIMLSINAFAAEIPEPTSGFYVNDFANIIPDETEQEMKVRAETLADSSDGVQVVVTTVQTIGDSDAVQYATDMYNKYEIGKNSMGVIIMLSVETRDIQIRTGDNMTKYLSASAINSILENDGYPYLRNDEFDKGLEEIQKSIITHIEKKIDKDTVKNEVAVVPENESSEDVKRDGLLGAILASLGVIGGGIASFFGIDKYTKKRKAEKAAEKQAKIENSEIGKMKDAKILALETKLRDLKRNASRKIEKLKRDFNSHLTSQEQKINALEAQLEANREFKRKFASRRKRAVKAYPDLEGKVDAILVNLPKSIASQETLQRGDQLLVDDAKVKEIYEAKCKIILDEICDEVNCACHEMNGILEIPEKKNFSDEGLKGIERWKFRHNARIKAEEEEMIASSEFIQKKTERIKFLTNRLKGVESEESVSIRNVMQQFDSLRNSNNKRIKNLIIELAESDAEIAALKLRQEKSLEIYPDLDEKTDEIYRLEKIAEDKQKAKSVENYVSRLVSEGCNRLNLWKYDDALENYDMLSSAQKQYVPKDIIQQLKVIRSRAQVEQSQWEESERIRKDKEKAATVQNMMLSAMHYTITRHHLDELKRASNAYDKLSYEQRKYVSADINSLRDMQRKAQRLQNAYEEEERRKREEERRRREEEERLRRERRRQEEERRRRQQSSYRSSSSFSSRSNSGFGGRSSGRGGGGKF